MLVTISTAVAFVALVPGILGDEVLGIKFAGVGTSGAYNQITNMGSDGQCSWTPFAYSGSLAPYDEEVIFAFRGPLKLSKFAVYNFVGPTTKRAEPKPKSYARRHIHHHIHKRHPESFALPALERQDSFIEKRDNWVTATVNGEIVSWLNSYEVVAAPTPVGTKTALPTPVASPAMQQTAVGSFDTSAASYLRAAYYNSATQEADGLVFLANHGGSGSGVFDYQFGMSLSYVDETGTTGSANPKTLASTTIPSNTEFIIASNITCNDGGCGYTRPGGVAYHGFGGGQKVILMQVTMPSDGSNGFNADMPAIWALNQQILNTVQYGKPECSCWTTGCGEFDILEVLTPGSSQCTSSLHGKQAATPPNYILRPTSKATNYAVIFDQMAGTLQVQTLPDGTDFAASFTQAQVNAFAGLSCATYLF